MHTGDLGRIDADGFLYICGRNNDLIVLENGKKIFPEEIETRINEIEGVKESFVFENKNKINAKIVYNLSSFEGLPDNNIYTFFAEKIKVLNKSLPQYKRINSISVASEELEKTVTGKIKRNSEYEKIKYNKNDFYVDNYGDNTLKKLENILISQLGNITINKETNIVQELGADSLDMVEIFLKVEKEFNIKIEKEERKKVKKVNDLLEIVSAKK